MRGYLSAVLLLLATSGVQAQDSVIVIDPDLPPRDSVARAGPPPEVVTELLAAFNDSATTRVTGEVSVPAGSTFEGRLGIFRGALRIGGRIRGELVVVNATLYLLPTADVEGDLLVVGGRLIRSPEARHVGQERVFWDAAPVLRDPDGLLVVRERRRTLGDIAAAQASFQTGRVRTTLLLATGGTYNRIEGLPIVFGPTFELRPSVTTRLKLDLRGILRTAGGGTRLDGDVGYVARLEFGTPKAGIWGRVHSEVAPIEDQPLSPGENGWSAFLVQRDLRDWYQERGVGGGVWVQPTRLLQVELSLRRDNERSLRAVDPWSLFRNSDTWRRNPLIDDGHYVTAALQGVFDTRNDRDDPSTGWFLTARYEHGSSDDVAPVVLPPTVRPPIPTGGGYGFDRMLLDFRRYARLSPGFRANLRLRGDGWIGGDRLPMQRRVSVGGTDLLPGYAFRDVTCTPAGYDNAAEAALCDRSLMIQAEVRHRLSLNLGYRQHDREGNPGRFIGIEEADLVLLADAGTAWLAGDGPGQVPANRIPSFHEWKSDVGVGLDVGGLGAYLAKSLKDGEPVRFTVRLKRRF